MSELWSNAKNTSDRQCKCGTWINHWKKYSRYTFNTCSVKGCKNKAEYGAHVEKFSDLNRVLYITPMCPTCNKLDVFFELKGDDIPVREDACQNNS